MTRKADDGELSACIEQHHATSFAHTAQDIFHITPSAHQVVCSHGTAIRVATVEQALPLRAAAQRMQTDETAWRAAIAVHPACSGTGDDALAVLDPVARQMRHSASPSHAIGVLSVAGGLVSVGKSQR